MSVVFGGAGPSLVLFVSSLILLGLVVHAYRQPGTVGRRWFVLMTCLNIVWTTTYGLQLLSDDEWLVYSFHALSNTAAVAVPVVAVYFWLTVAGERSYIRPATVLPGFLLPTLTFVFHLLKGRTPLAYRTLDVQSTAVVTTVDSEMGPALLAMEGLTLVAVALTVIILILTFYRHWSLYRAYVPWIVLLYLVTIGAYIVARFGNPPISGLRLVPFTAPLQGFVYGHLLFRYDLPDIDFRTRRIGLSKAVNTLEDGLVIVDEDWRIIEANATIENSFDTPEQLIETPLADILGAETVQTLADGESTTISPRTGRELEATANPITSEAGEELGKVVLLKDVTALKAREQRLSVLNRVMRHNVRNQMTLVTANAQLLEHDLEGDHATKAAEIHEAAKSIVDLGQKARSLQDVIDSDEPYRLIDVSRLGREVIDDLAETYPHVEFVMRGQETMVRTQPNVLSTMLHTLVENGAQYNDSASPIVEVAVDRNEDGVTVTVSDNGPGIPQMELDALGSMETKLDHGNGLGLWLVQWGVDKLGGCVDFDVDDGTTVTVTIPDTTGNVGASESASV
jgi:signal transduction histidine kinase